MKVSIITVTYNCASTLRYAIESVLSQTYKNIEYIIIDGLSNDGTMDVVNRYRENIDVVVSEKDKGIYDAMNKGISRATGDIVGFLNSDDFLASNDVISRVVQAFEREPNLEGVHGNLYYVDKKRIDRVVRYWRTNEYSEKAFLRGWHPAHPTLYLRREVYQKYGGFKTELSLSADFELMLRFFECKHIVTRHLDLVMVKMRLGGATSKNVAAILKGVTQCKRAFEMNGFSYPWSYPFKRLLPKLSQYIIRKK